MNKTDTKGFYSSLWCDSEFTYAVLLRRVVLTPLFPITVTNPVFRYANMLTDLCSGKPQTSVFWWLDQVEFLGSLAEITASVLRGLMWMKDDWSFSLSGWRNAECVALFLLGVKCFLSITLLILEQKYTVCACLWFYSGISHREVQCVKLAEQKTWEEGMRWQPLWSHEGLEELKTVKDPTYTCEYIYKYLHILVAEIGYFWQINFAESKRSFQISANTFCLFTIVISEI